jgi:hypothetical protein
MPGVFQRVKKIFTMGTGATTQPSGNGIEEFMLCEICQAKLSEVLDKLKDAKY